MFFDLSNISIRIVCAKNKRRPRISEIQEQINLEMDQDWLFCQETDRGSNIFNKHDCFSQLSLSLTENSAEIERFIRAVSHPIKEGGLRSSHKNPHRRFILPQKTTEPFYLLARIGNNFESLSKSDIV